MKSHFTKLLSISCNIIYIYNMSVCAQTMSFQTMQNKTNKILYHSHMNGREEMGNHLGYLFLIEQTETNLEIEA